MENMEQMFDYEALAIQYGINQKDLDRLVDEVRKEFPDDEMMFELHVVRVLEWMNERKPH